MSKTDSACNGQAEPTPTPGDIAFFRFGARYGILPGASLNALCDDCQAFMTGGLEVLTLGHDDDRELTSADWSAVYLLRMAQGIFEEVWRRARALERAAQESEARHG